MVGVRFNDRNRRIELTKDCWPRSLRHWTAYCPKITEKNAYGNMSDLVSFTNAYF